MKKILSITLSLLIVMTSMSFAATAFAASKLPATSITSLSAKDNGFTVMWKKKTKITGYQIQYSTSSKFSKKSTKTVKVKKAKTTSKKIADLKSSKKYYVRVRTYKNSKKKTDYSAWSKKKSVTTSEPYWCDEGGTHHSMPVGDMGKWFANRNELKSFYEKKVAIYDNQWFANEITDDEYSANCPRGYECWSCAYCGKWTGNFYYH